MAFAREFIDEMMRRALREAAAGAAAGEGGPFGAVVVDAAGNVLAEAHNRVLAGHDATAHAEVMVIRAAGERLGTHDLAGCTLFSSCEPCPMCLAAVIWANIKQVYFGGTRADAAEIGFRDAAIYDYLAGDNAPGLQVTELSGDDCRRLFAEYRAAQREIY